MGCLGCLQLTFCLALGNEREHVRIYGHASRLLDLLANVTNKLYDSGIRAKYIMTFPPSRTSTLAVCSRVVNHRSSTDQTRLHASPS